jgi:A/G-specific adenine glycosylase
VISPKNKSRDRFFHYWVIVHHDRLFLNKREKKDIWLGLFDFPAFESDHKNTGFSNHPVVRQLQGNHTLMGTRKYRHILTHQTIHAIFYRWILTVEDTKLIELLPGKGRFYSREETDQLPKPGLIDKYLKEE